MNRLYLYRVAFRAAIRRAMRRAARSAGAYLRNAGKLLLALDEGSSSRWTVELLRRCYLADAEFYAGAKTFRGPMYAAYVSGDTLSLSMNWLAEKGSLIEPWRYPHGGGILKLKRCGAPHLLETGDIWFTFDGGYAILYVGGARSERLLFEGPPNILRTFTYF